MRTLAFIIILCFCKIAANCQVHVRGYYRSNGTYVAPHERTRPNSTITDNYSYPGNYNPNNGDNRNYSISPNDYTPPVYYSESEGSKISIEDKQEVYVTTQTVRLRASPSTSGEVICNLSHRQRLLLVEDGGYGWKKVLYMYYRGKDLQRPRYVVGFVSAGLVGLNCPVRKKEYVYSYGRKYEVPSSAYGYFPEDDDNFDAVSNYLKDNYERKEALFNSNKAVNSEECLYTTKFDNMSISTPPPLRNSPSFDSPSIYYCPRNSIICVIEKTHLFFYKVKIDNQIGYMQKGFLLRQ